MALIKLSSNLDGIDGSIGQLTYTKVRYGTICKTKSQPGSAHPFTPSQAQLDLRNFFHNSIAMWKTLTTAQVEAWNDLAKEVTFKNIFGEEYHPSGYNLFMEVNQNRQLLNLSVYANAPLKPTIDGISNFNIRASLTPSFSIQLIFDGYTTPNGIDHLIYCTPGCPAGKSYLRNKYRVSGIIPQATANSFDFTTDFLNKFPTPAAGQRIRCVTRPIGIFSGFPGSHALDWTTVLP